jgi:hypothetical protein
MTTILSNNFLESNANNHLNVIVVSTTIDARYALINKKYLTSDLTRIWFPGLDFRLPV